MANLDRSRRLPKTVVILVGPSEVCVAAPGAVVAAVAAAAPIPFLICVQGDPSIHRTSVHLSGDDDDDSTAPCYQFGQVRYTHTMVIWVVKFLQGDAKLDRFLNQSQHAQWKLVYFVNIHSGEPSKIGH